MINTQIDFFDKLFAQDFNGAAEIFSNEGRLIFPGGYDMVGKRRVAFLLRRIHSNFEAEGRFIVKKEIIGNDIKTNNKFLITEWDVRGTYKTGKPYINAGISLLELDNDGKVKCFRDYFDSTDFSGK